VVLERRGKDLLAEQAVVIMAVQAAVAQVL
jgi:hypothetical protein